MSALPRLLGIARPLGRRLGAAALLQALTVAAGVGLTGTSAWLLSRAALHPSIAVLQLAIVGVRGFGVGRAALRWAERVVSHDATLRLLARLRLEVFRALVPLAPARLQDHRAGDVLSRVVEDVASLEGFYVRILGPSLAALAVALLAGALLLPRGAGIAAAALLGFAAAGLAAPALSARLAAGAGREAVALRGELSARLIDGIRGSAELLAFGGEGAHAEAVSRLSRKTLEAQARTVRSSAAGTACAGLAADLGVVAVLALAATAVRAGRLPGVQLAVATLVTLACYEATSALPPAWQALGSTRAAAARLFELLDTSPAVTEPQPAVCACSTAAEGVALFECRNLRFAYPGAHRPALDGVSLSLSRGRRVAIVGPSGSGKSTLAQLLLRFQPVPPGTMLLEGRDVCELPSDAVRARISYAAQRVDILSGTLRENLALGRAGASDEELVAVLHTLALGHLLERTPAGLDGWLGEQGEQLSGGEQQRLGLARALLGRGTLLLLDEPTAHLDALTERTVMDAILRAGEGRATLLVSHRLVALDRFDEVIVLSEGRAVERGRASELALRGGAYASLLRRQRDVAALGDATLGDASLEVRPQAPRPD